MYKSSPKEASNSVRIVRLEIFQAVRVPTTTQLHNHGTRLRTQTASGSFQTGAVSGTRRPMLSGSPWRTLVCSRVSPLLSSSGASRSRSGEERRSSLQTWMSPNSKLYTNTIWLIKASNLFTFTLMHLFLTRKLIFEGDKNTTRLQVNVAKRCKANKQIPGSAVRSVKKHQTVSSSRSKM